MSTNRFIVCLRVYLHQNLLPKYDGQPERTETDLYCTKFVVALYINLEVINIDFINGMVNSNRIKLYIYEV